MEETQIQKANFFLTYFGRFRRLLNHEIEGVYAIFLQTIRDHLHIDLDVYARKMDYFRDQEHFQAFLHIWDKSKMLLCEFKGISDDSRAAYYLQDDFPRFIIEKDDAHFRENAKWKEIFDGINDDMQVYIEMFNTAFGSPSFVRYEIMPGYFYMQIRSWQFTEERHAKLSAIVLDLWQQLPVVYGSICARQEGAMAGSVFHPTYMDFVEFYRDSFAMIENLVEVVHRQKECDKIYTFIPTIKNRFARPQKFYNYLNDFFSKHGYQLGGNLQTISDILMAEKIEQITCELLEVLKHNEKYENKGLGLKKFGTGSFAGASIIIQSSQNFSQRTPFLVVLYARLIAEILKFHALDTSFILNGLESSERMVEMQSIPVIESEAIALQEFTKNLSVPFTIWALEEHPELSGSDLLTFLKKIGIVIKSGHAYAVRLDKIERVSLDMSKFLQLQHLRIDHSDGQTINACISTAKALVTLEIFDSSLQELTPSIGDLIYLKELSIAGTQLTFLPDSIGNLKALKRLEVFNNKLETIPETLGNIKGLKAIVVDSNNLHEIPEIFGKLSNCTQVYASQNYLQNLPESLCRLKKLEFINFANNKLNAIPDCIGTLENLKEMNFGFNTLTSLPSSIMSLPRGCKFLVEGNPLTNITNEMREWLKTISRKLKK